MRLAALLAGVGLALATWAADELALPFRELAPGLYVHEGAQEETTPANRGDIANLGFIVGRRCVAVIDTGGSIGVGRAARTAVRKVTALPICYVINTHVHPDHILGNAAFLEDRPSFVGHAKLAAAMGARGPFYLGALRRDAPALAEGSELVPPTLAAGSGRQLDLGERVIELRPVPTAHTDNDLTVYDRTTETLWAADLLFAERIPVLDGNLKGWLAWLAQLRAHPPKRVVPGHGPIDARWPAALAAQERYLAGLQREVKQALAAKLTLAQAVERTGQGERERWLLFDAFHRRNVTAAYTELEWDE